MSRSSGFISVPRAMFEEDPFWLEHRPRTKFEAWLDLVQLATHKPYDHQTASGPVHLERGEVLLSLRFMADRWGWSVKVVRRWLESGPIRARLRAQRREQEGTVYLVVHYETYSQASLGAGTRKGTAPGTTVALEGHKNNNSDNKTSRGAAAPEPSPTAPEPSSLDILPKSVVDQCLVKWGRFGGVNYARLRQALLECVQVGIPADQLPNAVEAYEEWYGSLDAREQQFNPPTPERFAQRAAWFAKLGQQPYYDDNKELTARGALLYRGIPA